MKKKFPEVWKYGLKFSIAIVIVAVLIGAVSKYRNRNSNPRSDGDSEKVESSDIVMCGGLKKPVLNRVTTPITQVVRGWDCFSMILIPPSSAKSKVAVNSPGAVEICFWKKNRCVAWMRTGNKQIHEKVRGEIPSEYSAILMRGDPGNAEVHLLR